MIKRKEDEPKKGAAPWMNTYGDMMTLLLTFFVLLFSMSTIDAEKFQALVSSFSASVSIFNGSQTIINTDVNILQNGMSQFPVQQNVDFLQQAAQMDQIITEAEEELKAYVEEKALKEKVTVEKKGDEVILRFSDVALFDSGKAAIKPAAIPSLDAIGNKLIEYVNNGYHLRVEGHTDNVPIRTAQFPSNWELSSARAIAVMRFYLEEMNFTPSQLSSEGMGEYHPISSNDTTEGKAMNRRVEIKLSKSLS